MRRRKGAFRRRGAAPSFDHVVVVWSSSSSLLSLIILFCKVDAMIQPTRGTKGLLSKNKRTGRRRGGIYEYDCGSQLCLIVYVMLCNQRLSVFFIFNFFFFYNPKK